MSIFRAVLKAVTRPPALKHREGKPPYASFCRQQFWAYPELCLQQVDEALQYCTPEDQRRQRATLALCVSPRFLAN